MLVLIQCNSAIWGLYIMLVCTCVRQCMHVWEHRMYVCMHEAPRLYYYLPQSLPLFYDLSGFTTYYIWEKPENAGGNRYCTSKGWVIISPVRGVEKQFPAWNCSSREVVIRANKFSKYEQKQRVLNYQLQHYI